MSGDEKNDIQLSDETKARIEALVINHAEMVAALIANQIVAVSHQLSTHQIALNHKLTAAILSCEPHPEKEETGERQPAPIE